jgi:hypothetical protein
MEVGLTTGAVRELAAHRSQRAEEMLLDNIGRGGHGLLQGCAIAEKKIKVARRCQTVPVIPSLHLRQLSDPE